ncbi:acetyl-CoA hydrolase/transferase family protein [Candidatus Acetothermia bacterium]|nr:acetyl-CoA hydrolase/transferase family protein [Candidatus Acetothermia bacterium]MBI3460518.1 acetyl-CoA hydrolase/transferase family protein [Candidatus Acetothermia bacterium]MBI3661099.1 acetyl-CoA hydrolase/transferase family protein [Candidatus Acetothermia bacterium]
MNWLEAYQKKICTPDEAVAIVKSSQRIYVSGNAATPFVLLEALARRKDELSDVQVIHVLLLGKGREDPLSKPDMEGHFRHNSLFVGPADREAVKTGRADYIPIFLSEIPDLLRKELPIDVALIHTSSPDEHGFLSLGVECVSTKAALESATVVIAQVNEKMPRTLGDSFVHASKITKAVETSEALPELLPEPPGPVEEQIGRHIAELVEDGATLQMGIGGIPDAVLKQLHSRKNLGIHSEMASDGVMELMEAGVITGAHKTLHRGKVVATFLLGSRRLYEFAHNNPAFEIHPADYTNNPFIVAQNEKMVAINSAIEVDITGQVCADSIGYQIYSGFGGQLDFIRGAAHSKGGKPIIALPSTAKGDKFSRIVPALKEGAGVVTTRGDVHYIVTEFGIAYLHGKNLRERAQALIEIAHPKFRDELERSFSQRFSQAVSLP